MRSLVIGIVALGACVGAPEGVKQQPDPSAGHYVRAIALSTTRGEVGRPFKAQVSFESNYVRPETAEYQVLGLPPGLVFDPARRAIAGSPQRAGFFTVQVSIRKPVDPGRMHRPTPDERWWPEEIEVEIYAPVGP